MMSDSCQVDFILRYRKDIRIKYAAGDLKQYGIQGEVCILES